MADIFQTTFSNRFSSCAFHVPNSIHAYKLHMLHILHAFPCVHQGKVYVQLISP